MADDEKIRWRVEFHKALGNPNRLEILDFIGEEEICQCEIFPKIGLAQSTISAYLTQMVRAGILQERKDGTRKLYRISSPHIRKIVDETQIMANEMVK